MIHLFYGDSAASAFACFHRAQASIVLREAFASGPAALVDEGWPELRAHYLAQEMGASLEGCRRESGAFEAALANLDLDEEVVCWFGRDLFCQIGLIYVLTRLSERRPTTVSLASPAGGAEGPYCFGDIAPAEMNTLLTERQPLNALHFQHAAIAWHLYASADPLCLNSVFDGSLDLGAQFAEALELHASRFPSTIDGLGALERALLTSLRDGPLPFSEVFRLTSQRTKAFRWGDLPWRNLCWQLCQSSPPLLAAPGAHTSADLQQVPLALTPEGRAVLLGQSPAPQREAYWLGGCRVTQASPWRWDGSARRVVRSL